MIEMRDQMHGKLSEITDEKEVIQTSVFVSRHMNFISNLTTLSRKEKRCIIHFYHKNFNQCEIMDKHLNVRDINSGSD